MSVKVYHDLLKEDERLELIDYLENNKNLVRDIRPDVTSIDLDINGNQWHQILLKKICDAVVNEGWTAEYVVFWKSKISVPLHTDTGDGNPKSLTGKNILIPLEWHGGDASTVVFKNRWNGPKALFMKKEKSRYRTFIPKKDGTITEIEDIRLLNDISEFDITEEELNKIKETRVKKHKGDPRISDYSLLTDYDSHKSFDSHIQQKYMKHIPLSDLHGLQVDKVIEWQKNTVYTWDRQQLHCAGSGHKIKSMVTIFAKS